MTWLCSKYTMKFEYSQRLICGCLLVSPPRGDNLRCGAPQVFSTWAMLNPRRGRFMPLSCCTRWISRLSPCARDCAALACGGTARPAAAASRMAIGKLLVNLTMAPRSEEHTSELQSRRDLVCRLLLEK